MSPNPQKEPHTDRTITIFRAVVVIVGALLLAYWVYATTVNPDSKYPFKYGLDLAGGSHLVYEADVSAVDPADVSELMSILREVIERRVNAFGVSEPIVQVEQSSAVAGERRERLIVELPGVADVEDAKNEIGKTPLLEFKLIDAEALATQNALEQVTQGSSSAVVKNVTMNGEAVSTSSPYIDTGLTGRYLSNAQVVFGQGVGLANEPIVSITFNDEGGRLFEEITRANVGEQLAIFLDGSLVSAPRINEAISGGKAVISGNFTAVEARDLVQNLNFGSLPMPISLVSTQSIGPSVGERAMDAGANAGIIGLLAIAFFMTFWYRLPGFFAAVSLVIYVLMMLVIFKLIPVTLTAAGIAGLVLSIGLAVDANILISERLGDELRRGRKPIEAIREGFAQAWTSIRDGNLVNVLSGVILYWFGDVFIEGFAFTLIIGTIVSLVSSLVISRTLLMAFCAHEENTGITKFLLGSGFRK